MSSQINPSIFCTTATRFAWYYLLCLPFWRVFVCMQLRTVGPYMMGSVVNFWSYSCVLWGHKSLRVGIEKMKQSTWTLVDRKGEELHSFDCLRQEAALWRSLIDHDLGANQVIFSGFRRSKPNSKNVLQQMGIDQYKQRVCFLEFALIVAYLVEESLCFIYTQKHTQTPAYSWTVGYSW